MAPAPHPDDRAIVVGIDHYRNLDPSVTLTGACNDAELFASWLVDPEGGGLEPANIRKFVSSSVGPARPLRDELEDAAASLINEASNAPAGRLGRRLYLYFAGHGVTARNRSDEICLIMSNARMPSPLFSIPGRLLTASIQMTSAFDEIVLLMDCCREVMAQAPAPELSYLSQPVDSGSTGKKFLGFSARWSSRAAEKTMPNPLGGPALPHGIFTHAVLEGLRGAAAPGTDVTTGALKSYVKARVPELGPPDAIADAEILDPDDFVLATRRTASSTLHVELTEPALGYQVLSGIGFTRLTVPPLAAGATGVDVPLDPGWYLVAVPGDGNVHSRSARVQVTGGRIDVRL